MPDRTPIIPAGASVNPALSPGIRVGDLLFVSGHVAQDGSGNLVGAGDCEAQARQVFANIRAVVETAGATMQDVVKITGFLTNLDDFPAYNKVRRETFPTSPPASSSVIVAGLVLAAYLVEVEAVVRIP